MDRSNVGRCDPANYVDASQRAEILRRSNNTGKEVEAASSLDITSGVSARSQLLSMILPLDAVLERIWSEGMEASRASVWLLITERGTDVEVI